MLFAPPQKAQLTLSPASWRLGCWASTFTQMCWRRAQLKYPVTIVKHPTIRAKPHMLLYYRAARLPHEVGYLAAYLLPDASEFMTGSVRQFEGGPTAVMALSPQATNTEG